MMSQPIEPTFGYLVSSVGRLLRKSFDQRARELGLSLAQCRTITYLACNEGINQARLADLLEIQPITMARLLDRMEAAGWVERRADQCDRRVYRLHLTDKVRPLSDRIQSMATAVRQEALSGLDEDEKQVLMTLLKKVHANLAEGDGAAAAGRGRGKRAANGGSMGR